MSETLAATTEADERRALLSAIAGRCSPTLHADLAETGSIAELRIVAAGLARPEEAAALALWADETGLDRRPRRGA